MAAMKHELICRPQALLDAGHRGARRSRRPWRIFSKLRAVWEMLPQAYAARRHYEQLLSRGVGHDAALRRALGVAPGRIAGCQEGAASKAGVTQQALAGIKYPND